MGSVWRAYHLGLRVPVALKFLVEEHIESEDARARFAHEASAAARIRSPHVVTTLDYGEDHGTPYLAMELLEGEDLQTRLERETVLPAGEVERIVAQVCKGLGKAHAAGIIHRDIKPANIFLAVEDGELCVKLLDFGVAKAWAPRPDDLPGMNTVFGRILGTPMYMSPEQATGDALADHRSDLYSLAVVAYVALAGRPPFLNANQIALLLDVCQKPPPPPSQFNSHLGTAFDAFFARALAKQPEGRFSSTKELLEHFSAAVRSAPQLGRPEGTAARLLGRFLPVRLLSSSALSEVYLVHQGSGDVEVLKILKRHAGLPPPLIDQLRRRVEAANLLPSGSFVRTREVGVAPEFGHAPFLRLEYAPGVDLGELSRDRALPLPQALAFLEQIADALTEAHQAGLTHGDLRPQCVFVPPSQPGRLKISGLGLSSFTREASQHRETGLMHLGPLYMAPEVARGRSGGAPTDDIWSVGLLAFRLLTGRDYWTGGDAMHIIAQLIHEPIVPPSARGLALGPGFDAWFMRSCDRDPARRFSSCQEQQDALRAALAGRG